MSKSTPLRIQCPLCKEFRIVMSSPSKFSNGFVKPCVHCCKRTSGTKDHSRYQEQTRQYTSWDSDPWAEGKLGWSVMKNALLDGWTA